MKNLFIFYMITASTVCSVHAQQQYEQENVEESHDFNMGYEADEESGLDDIADCIRGDIVIEKAIPTYYDYAHVVYRVWYLYCIQKPYLFCKLYMNKLRLLFKQKKQYEQ